MRKARLDEAQAGIKISGRDINNLMYTDDTTLMAEGAIRCLFVVVVVLKNTFLFDFSCFEFTIPFLPFEHNIEQHVENMFFMNIFYLK